jgi:hypothetical protein
MRQLRIILIFLAPFGLVGQVNLVPNPSFELCSSYPPFGGTTFADVDVFHWYNPNTLSPDYYNAENSIVLLNQNIPDGQAFVGIATYDPLGTNGREYVECELLDTLLVNGYYVVEFYASVGEGMSRFAANNLGIHLSDTSLHSNNMLYFDVDAQIKNFNNEIIEDTVNWIKVSGLYQAQGGERFLTIGNFNTDAETTQGKEFMDGAVWQAYYSIDKVSVIPLDSIIGGLPVDAGPDQTIYIGDTAFIGQKISNMPSNWFVLNGAQVASNTAGTYVWPEETTTYLVTQTLNGVFSSDTVTVFVEGVGLAEPSIPAFTVAPNPAAGTFNLYLEKPLQQPTQIVLYDNTGRIVFEQTAVNQSSVIVLIAAVQPGVYFLELRQNGVSSSRQRVVME